MKYNTSHCIDTTILSLFGHHVIEEHVLAALLMNVQTKAIVSYSCWSLVLTERLLKVLGL